MRFKSSLLVLGCITASFGTSEAAPVRKIVPKGATNFTSKAQRFAIWLPTKPAKSSGHSPLANSGSFSFKSQMGGVNCGVNVSLYAPNELTNPNDHLNMMQEGFTQSASIKLLKVEAIRLNGCTGRETVLSMAKGTILFRGRSYVTPRGILSIVAGGKTADMQKQAAQINRVFDSFRILPQK